MIRYTEYKLVSTSPEFTQSLGAEYARVVETLRPESAVWGLELSGERHRGKSTFANAFAAAVMENHADTSIEKRMAWGRLQKADYRSDAAKIHIRCGDSRAGFETFLRPREAGYAGYDVIEHGWQVPHPRACVDFGRDDADERGLTFNASREIEETPAFQALMHKFGALRVERRVGAHPS